MKNNSDSATTTADSRLSLLEQVEMMREAAQKRHGPGPPSETDSKLPTDLEPSSMGPSPEVVRNSRALHRKRQRARFSANASVRVAVETIDHFTLFVPVKMLLCLGTVSRDGQGPQQSDANGWGKAALLGLERMRVAWTLPGQHTPLLRIRRRTFPVGDLAACSAISSAPCQMRAAFIRPGFDEMEEVSLSDSKLRRH